MARYDHDLQHSLRLYSWNIELTSAFLGPLSLLEVVLRNAMHDALRSGRQADWWNTKLVRLAPREASMVKEVLDKLAYAGNPNPTSDDVIGASSFGLWTGLLDVGIARDPFYDYETAIWRPRLERAFPNKGQLTRGAIHRQLNRVRKFRNRVMHNEPIFNAGFQDMKALIVESTGWIDGDISNYISQSHRIDEVVARSEDAIMNGDCRL
jgi:hypothetical protein